MRNFSPLVLIDASIRWSHVCLLSTRNVAFARLLVQMTKLRTQFPDYPIKTIRLDNASEFTSQTLNDYYMSIGINIEHPKGFRGLQHLPIVAEKQKKSQQNPSKDP